MMNRFANLSSSFAIIPNEFWKIGPTLSACIIKRFCDCTRIPFLQSFEFAMIGASAPFLPIRVRSSKINKRIELDNFAFLNLLLHFGVVNFAIG